MVTVTFTSPSSPLLADSAAAKSKKQKQESLHALVFLDIPLRNFGNEEQNKFYEEIKFKYTRALSFYFEDDFVNAYQNFLKVQKDLEKIYEKLSIDYVDRTEVILKSVLKTIAEVDIKYYRDSYLVQNMLKNIEAPDEKPYYEEKEFHFTYDKRDMVGNIDQAYQNLGYAKQLRREGINLQRYLEDGQLTPASFRSERIKKYINAVKLCRKAKRNAIYVYQLIDRNKMLETEPAYKDNAAFLEKLREPVFDKSVPKDYVVDLNDALGRVHSLEAVNLILGRQR